MSQAPFPGFHGILETLVTKHIGDPAVRQQWTLSHCTVCRRGMNSENLTPLEKAAQPQVQGKLYLRDELPQDPKILPRIDGVMLLQRTPPENSESPLSVSFPAVALYLLRSENYRNNDKSLTVHATPIMSLDRSGLALPAEAPRNKGILRLTHSPGQSGGTLAGILQEHQVDPNPARRNIISQVLFSAAPK